MTTTYPPHPGAQQLGQGIDQAVSHTFVPNITNNSPRESIPPPLIKPRTNTQAMTSVHSPPSDAMFSGNPVAVNAGISTGGANNLGGGRSDLPPVDINKTYGSYTQVQPSRYQPNQVKQFNKLLAHIKKHATAHL